MVILAILKWFSLRFPVLFSLVVAVRTDADPHSPKRGVISENPTMSFKVVCCRGTLHVA